MSLTLAVPPAPNSLLAGTLDAVVEWLNDPAQEWPARSRWPRRPTPA